MSEPIENRYEFVLLFDVKNGNPNGDPDGGNMPRIDPETGHGITTDVCLKRRVRNYVELVHKDNSPNRIYIKEKAILALRRKPAYDSVEEEKDEVKKAKKTKKEEKEEKEEKISKGRIWMCKNFFDVRTFGAVMSTEKNDCGQVRGPVQLSFSRSIDPIVSLQATITRMAVETEKQSEEQGGGNRSMGRKAYIPYGLYRTHGFISAPLAKQTGFSEEDLRLFWDSLINMFEHDRSASRGEMAAQKLIVFKHSSELGNAPSQNLFALVKTERRDKDNPPRTVSDYRITVDRGSAPKGIKVIEMP